MMTMEFFIVIHFLDEAKKWEVNVLYFTNLYKYACLSLMGKLQISCFHHHHRQSRERESGKFVMIPN